MDDDERTFGSNVSQSQYSANRCGIYIVCSHHCCFRCVLQAGFLLVYIGVIGGVAFLACICLIVSIVLRWFRDQGRRIGPLDQHPQPLPAHYDGGYLIGKLTWALPDS